MYELIHAMYRDTAGEDLVVEVNTVTGGVIKGLLMGVTQHCVTIAAQKPPRTYGEAPTFDENHYYVALQHVVYVKEA